MFGQPETVVVDSLKERTIMYQRLVPSSYVFHGKRFFECRTSMGTRKMDRGVRTLFALVPLLALNLQENENERARGSGPYSTAKTPVYE